MGREFEELGGTLETPMSADVAVDVAEDDEELRITADLPGFDREEIDVELRDEALTIAAMREETSETDVDADEGGDDGEGDVRYHVRERRRRAVSRRIPLPAPIDPEGASASHTNGVLTVTLPKRSATDSDGHSIDIN